ncbi:MAG: N-acyl homoserine lactonase family protein [Acidobacteriia bacterium]|nr:N-acyl homoserine lactonase family protein [Terriglobia bacterium]
MKRWIVGVVVLTVALLTSIYSAQSPSPPTYEVYAIRYAILPDFPVAGLVAGADKNRKLDIAMMVWLLKGPNGRNVLVDSGFYRDRFFKHSNPKNYIKPSEAVAKAGVKPEDVTDVVITHMHWDHVDGADLFPKATVWIQKEEYRYYTGEAWQPGGTHGGIYPDDVLMMVKLNVDGRVRLVDGDNQEFIPGITAYTGGKHTFASQFLGVHTQEGTVVVASDNMYLYENLEHHVAIAQSLDPASNLKAIERMARLASNARLIVPGHDPQVFERFQTPGNGVAKIQ